MDEKITPESIFADAVLSLKQKKIEHFPHSIFFMSGDSIHFEYNKNKKVFYCYGGLAWKLFEQCGMYKDERLLFLKRMIASHFKIEDVEIVDGSHYSETSHWIKIYFERQKALLKAKPTLFIHPNNLVDSNGRGYSNEIIFKKKRN